MKNKYYLVYKTTNLKNGKFYIGVHETYNLDDSYMGSGKVLRNSIYYHGKENFKRKILEFCENKKSMYQKEKELVTEELIKNLKCMNLVVGGAGFISDEKHREISSCAGKAYANKLKTDNEFKKMIHNIRSEKAKTNYKLGIYKDKKYDNFKNMNHTNETKKIMSKAHKGKGIGNKNSQYNTCWITNGIINKKINKTNINSIANTEWKLGRIIKGIPA